LLLFLFVSVYVSVLNVTFGLKYTL
jgi:hypothetical protein